MNPNLLFNLANGVAFIGWLLLLIFPFRPFTNKAVVGVVVTLLCGAYAALVFSSIKPADFEKFSTLEGVTSLFTMPNAVLVGWLHYLAFDLVVGVFIAQNAAKHGIKHAVIVPCLIFTFMLGPVGLLLYLVIRWAVLRHYFATNF
ncbi:MAG: DUF4281 domain-containing protein [Bacteroidetes bacterium]|nr:MAG: DUF4281 domain-containing protein [Bacteroidota bacterium]